MIGHFEYVKNGLICVCSIYFTVGTEHQYPYIDAIATIYCLVYNEIDLCAYVYIVVTIQFNSIRYVLRRPLRFFLLVLSKHFAIPNRTRASGSLYWIEHRVSVNFISNEKMKL